VWVVVVVVFLGEDFVRVVVVIYWRVVLFWLWLVFVLAVLGTWSSYMVVVVAIRVEV